MSYKVSIKAVVAGLFILGVLLFALMIVSQQLIESRKRLAAFTVQDPRSQTTVRVDGIEAVFGPTQWGCTISVDGKRPTQHTGWPKGLVDANAAPVEVKWHGDPDWVEIVLSSGERLKLTWDASALEKARQSSEKYHWLDPRFEVVK